MNKSIYLVLTLVGIVMSSALAFAGIPTTIHNPVTGEAVGEVLVDSNSACSVQDGNVICPGQPVETVGACIQECAGAAEPGNPDSIFHNCLQGCVDLNTPRPDL